MESPLALYRRYRPETFAEVIGQDHVTEPLRAALAANRVNHAYLFSGPRGCGKTTSARILARALNCAQAPIADPCGECDSCRDLARGGPGSIDVIEIDAASHGGVDDARDLREKAFFAPVRDRYKVYIIDEAHMVTTQGFNALLKLVEEPPPHLRFIFATTEPDKVLPTIRSRTHHYPFRLIPPRLLSDYLSQLAAEEGVAIEPAALPLVVRAGAGSARDTLSVLDQLLGGAGPGGVTHKLATDLLGFTPDSLLDEVVEAFATRDGAAGLLGRRQGRRDRSGPAPLHRGPAAPAARPRDRDRGARRPRDRADRRPGGRRRAPRRPGRALRCDRAEPGRRHRGRRPHRDARRHRAATAARAALRARAAAGRRPHRRRRDGPPRAARAPDRRDRRPGARLGRPCLRSVPTGRPGRARRRPARRPLLRKPRPPLPPSRLPQSAPEAAPSSASQPAPRGDEPVPPPPDAGGAHGRARLTRPRRRSAATPADAGVGVAAARDAAGAARRRRAGAGPGRRCRSRRSRSPSSRPVLAAASAWSTYAGCGPTSSSRPRTVAAWPGWCSPSTPTWSTSTESG